MNQKPVKSERRSYVVKGYLEYEAVIPTSGGSLRIHFQDGTLSGYGTAHARFSTSEPDLQQIIEGSPQFKARIIQRAK